MIIIQKYQIFIKNNTYHIHSLENPTCPLCQGVLKTRDSKRRMVISSDSEIRTFHLRRLKCTKCGVLHVELPDLLIPHKHYSRDVIEAALQSHISTCPAENSTIYRWSRARAEHKL